MKLVATAARDAAAEVLAREASKGARQAAEYVSQKAPELAMQKLQEHGGSGPAAQAALSFGKAKLEDAGGVKAALAGAGGAVKGLVDKVTGGGRAARRRASARPAGSRSSARSTSACRARRSTTSGPSSRTRRSTPCTASSRSSKGDETTFTVGSKVWGFKREWEVEITDQEPNERIAWKTAGGTKNAGVVTFHELDENLTRVLVTLDWPPDGVIEKMASGTAHHRARHPGRPQALPGVHGDARRGDRRGRGRIEDSEVVSEERAHEAAEDEERDEAEAEVDEPRSKRTRTSRRTSPRPRPTRSPRPRRTRTPRPRPTRSPRPRPTRSPRPRRTRSPRPRPTRSPRPEEEKPKPKPRRRRTQKPAAEEQEEEKPKPRRRPQQRRQRATARK